MPLFNYQCTECYNIVEKFQHSVDSKVNIICNECGSDKFERLISSTQNRVCLNARDNLHQKILPDAKRISNNINNGSDNAFLDICGEK